MKRNQGEAAGMEAREDEERRPGLSTEAAAWIALGVLSLLLRIAALDAAPLSAGEAGQAMLAWRAATGQGMPAGGSYSPILLWANGLLFWLLGAADGTARLLPALCGVALTVAPALLRRRLGRVGALAAGGYLAISPTALLASRQVDGRIAVALGGLLVLGGSVRFGETHERRWLFLAAVGAAMSLTAGPWAIGMLVSLALAWVSLAWVRAEGEVGSAWRAARPHILPLCGLFALGILVFAIGPVWNRDGLVAAGRMIVEWVGELRGGSSQLSPSPLTILLVYEPLAIVFALGGLAVAARKGERFLYSLGTWVLLAALLVLAAEGRKPADILIAVAGLALLAGRGIDYLVRSLEEAGRFTYEGLHAVAIVVLLGHLYLLLARYSAVSEIRELALYSALAGLAILLIGSSVAALALLVSRSAGLRGGALGLGLGLLVYTLSAAWGVAYLRPHDPRELLVNRPTPVDVRDLVETLQGLSWRNTGTEASMPIATDAAPDSALAWYLKDFEAVDWVPAVGGVTDEYDVLVSQSTSLGSADAVFVGQDFALTATWDPGVVRCYLSWPPACGATVEWLVARDSTAPPAAEELAVVWARKELVVIEVVE
jgi:uncharacterized protein (TIGR03663 family)